MYTKIQINCPFFPSKKTQIDQSVFHQPWKVEFESGIELQKLLTLNCLGKDMGDTHWVLFYGFFFVFLSFLIGAGVLLPIK